jgi:hypothetical protein
MYRYVRPLGQPPLRFQLLVFRQDGTCAYAINVRLKLEPILAHARRQRGSDV